MESQIQRTLFLVLLVSCTSATALDKAPTSRHNSNFVATIVDVMHPVLDWSVFLQVLPECRHDEFSVHLVRPVLDPLASNAVEAPFILSAPLIQPRHAYHRFLFAKGGGILFSQINPGKDDEMPIRTHLLSACQRTTPINDL